LKFRRNGIRPKQKIESRRLHEKYNGQNEADRLAGMSAKFRVKLWQFILNIKIVYMKELKINTPLSYFVVGKFWAKSRSASWPFI